MTWYGSSPGDRLLVMAAPDKHVHYLGGSRNGWLTIFLRKVSLCFSSNYDIFIENYRQCTCCFELMIAMAWVDLNAVRT